jgi:hypothetical protein
MTIDGEPAKVLLPYLQRADELQKHDHLAAYYCEWFRDSPVWGCGFGLVGVWEDGFVRIMVVEMVTVFVGLVVGWRFGDWWWRGFGQSGGGGLGDLWILGCAFWRSFGGMMVEAGRLYAMEKGLKIPPKERTSETKAILISLMNQLEKVSRLHMRRTAIALCGNW